MGPCSFDSSKAYYRLIISNIVGKTVEFEMLLCFGNFSVLNHQVIDH